MTEETLGSIGEFGLIEEVTSGVGTSDYVLLGPGDDAAHIATADGTYVVTTDILIEGKHFRRDWSSATEIGRKAAAVNLSDINAMGGVATALTVAFAAPRDLPVEWVREMTAGFESECAKVGAHLVGGDIAESDTIVISVTAFGDAERVVTRSDAQPGDVVAYTGSLGMSGAGYAALSRGFRSPKAAVDAHRVPEPPYAGGPAAAQAGATAMTDVSDGFLSDVMNIATASGVAISLDSSKFEVLEPVQTVGSALGGVDPMTFVLTGGEDYALVATFPADTTLPDGWTAVGEVSAGAGVTVDGEEPTGDLGHRAF